MKDLKNKLSNPGKEYLPWAMWILNGHIVVSEVEKQIKEFADKGFGGIVIKPFFDITPEFLSYEFVEIFKLIVNLAQGHNLKIRIAEDFSVDSSGFFQKILTENPSLRGRRLEFIESIDVEGKTQFEYKVDPAEKDDYIFVATTTKEGLATIKYVRELTSNSDGIVSWKALTGKWRVFVFKKNWWLSASGMYLPSFFNSKNSNNYLQSVFKTLFDLPSTYLKVIEGFVFELPFMSITDNSIPWDDDLIVKYKSRYKKNLIHMLPLLFDTIEDKNAKMRAHVYNFIYQTFTDKFLGPISNFLEKNKKDYWVLTAEKDSNRKIDKQMSNVFFTAHDNCAAAGIQNIEGGDKNKVIHKCVNDFNTLEYNRKSVGIIGRNSHNYSFSLNDLKNETDILVSNGVTKVILDGCFFNIDRRLYPKSTYSLFLAHPEWDRAGDLTSYIARMTYVASCARKKGCDIAVVFPQSSLAVEYQPNNYREFENAFEKFVRTCNKLTHHNIQFDIISENYFLDSSVGANGKVFCEKISSGNKNEYSVIVFPYSRLVNNSLFVQIEKFANKNATLIFIDDAPEGNFDDGVTTTFTARVNRLVDEKYDNVDVMTLNDLVANLSEEYRDVYIKSNGKINNDVIVKSFSTVDYKFFYLHNITDKDQSMEIEFPKYKYFYTVDPFNGSLIELSQSHEDGISSIRYVFGAKECAVIIAGNKKISGITKKSNKNTIFAQYCEKFRKYRVVLKNRWNFKAVDNNYLPVANWNLRIGLSKESGGFSHYYEGFFEVESIPEKTYLIFDDVRFVSKLFSDKNIEIVVNGFVLKAIDSFYEHVEDISENNLFYKNLNNIAIFKLDSIVSKGLNRISVRAVGDINDPASICYPPIIAGDFSLKKGQKGWIISDNYAECEYSSWTKIGFPFLTGRGVYSQLFEVPENYENILMRINYVSGSVGITINDYDFGVLTHQPMIVDITDHIKQRRNELKLTVFNTPDNILRMNGRISGLLGEVYLDIF